MSIYQPFIPTDKISKQKTNTYPTWIDSPLDIDTAGQATLTAGSIYSGFYTSSAQTSSATGSNPGGYWDGNYYLNIFAERVDSSSALPFNPAAEPQFSIAYGIHAMSASAERSFAGTFVGDTGEQNSAENSSLSYHLYSDTEADIYADPQKAVYMQFANLLDTENQGSNAILKTINPMPGSGTSPDPDPTNGPTRWWRANLTHITYAYFISIARNRMKDGIDPSSWRLVFSRGDNPNPPLVMIADLTSATTTTATKYNIIDSGSATKSVLGSFYPYKGIFVLDAKAVSQTCGFPTYIPYSNKRVDTYPTPIVYGALFAGDMTSFGTWATAGARYGVDPSRALEAFYGRLSCTGSTASPDYPYSASSFTANSVEEVSSNYYFVRVRNADFNASENPTWRTGSIGNIREPFIANPTTFITTVGLYDGDPYMADGRTPNDEPGNLIAIAKLSKPIMKSADSEALIKIRLDF